MTEAQRAELGRRAEEQRLEKFGTKSAAYQAASLNSATWDRIEKGLPVRDDRLRAAVSALWPESRGKWEKVFEPDPAPAVPGFRYGPPAPKTGLDGYLHRMMQRIEDLEDRVDALEASKNQEEEVVGNAEHPAPMNEAGETPAADDSNVHEFRGRLVSRETWDEDAATFSERAVANEDETLEEEGIAQLEDP